jgi:hypothetical protein
MNFQPNYKHFCDFFKSMTYDVVSFEMCITEVLPGHGTRLRKSENRKIVIVKPPEQTDSLLNLQQTGDRL